MLHTNIVSDLIGNPQGRAAKRIAKLGEDNICTSIIVSAELRYGCAKSGSKRLRREPRCEFGNSGVLLRHREDRRAPMLPNIRLTQICAAR
jgi:tRNA(fMet)-specific endonuclease VapC